MRGGYGYPGTRSWAPVALRGLPSGRERYRHRNRTSARALSGLESTAPKARSVLHSHCNELLRRSSIVPETHVRTLVGYSGIGLWSRRSRVRAPSVTPSWRFRQGGKEEPKVRGPAGVPSVSVLRSYCNPPVWNAESRLRPRRAGPNTRPRGNVSGYAVCCRPSPGWRVIRGGPLSPRRISP